MYKRNLKDKNLNSKLKYFFWFETIELLDSCQSMMSEYQKLISLKIDKYAKKS